MSQLIFLIFGIAIGYFIGINKKKEEPQNKPRKVINYIERQKAKVRYETDPSQIIRQRFPLNFSNILFQKLRD
ncbi:hypothetical protein F4T90_16350 [Acinetobacter junii]|nr:hypothetical protein [Acinetobacter junii]